MGLKITILGCGNSSGVPAVGNFWGKCDPNEPKNQRSRACLAVQSNETTIIIDTGADFRTQMNAHDIQDIDAVFYSHQHSDHCHGIDDLRSFYFRKGRQRVPCYMHEEAYADVGQRFDYLFHGGNDGNVYPAILDAHIYQPQDFGRVQKFQNISFIPYEMDHGTCTAVGFRFEDLSYSVDMKRLDQKALDTIKGSRVWIVDGAGHDNPDNFVHCDLKSIYEYNEYVGAQEVYITCLSSFMDYKAVSDELPEGFHVAYDGLSFKVGV